MLCESRFDCQIGQTPQSVNLCGYRNIFERCLKALESASQNT